MSKALVIACLRALDIVEAMVSLDGSGDSGDATFDYAITASGETLDELPNLTVDPFSPNESRLSDLILTVASNAPEGNWYDNEGGYGTVTFRPFEKDEDCRIECDMTYRDEYESEDDPDFEDDEDDAALLDDGADLPEPPPAITFRQGAEP